MSAWRKTAMSTTCVRGNHGPGTGHARSNRSRPWRGIEVGKATLRHACLGMAVLLSGQAWADGCHLKNFGTLPVEMVGERATTMVKINGSPTRFILDTGAFFNTMSSANASSLGLKLEPAPF